MMALRAIAIGVAALALVFLVGDEIVARYVRTSGNPALEDFISVTVRQHSNFAGGSHLNVVSGLVCPQVSREKLDLLAGMPGTLNIRVVEDRSPPAGPGRGYYIIPRVSIL